MNIVALKTVLLEVLSESMWGHKLKVMIGGYLYPALICKNVAHDIKGEGEYRLSWFDPKQDMKPQGHITFSENSKNYILSTKEFPMALKIQCFKNGQPIPQLIFEVVRQGPRLPTGGDILVGSIDPDDHAVDAKYGGTHKTLQVRNNDKSRFRYNDYSEICYWLEAHPKIYERIAEEYILNNSIGEKVKQHVTLDNFRDNPIAYEYYWNDAHGLEQPEGLATQLPPVLR